MKWHRERKPWLEQIEHVCALNKIMVRAVRLRQRQLESPCSEPLLLPAWKGGGRSWNSWMPLCASVETGHHSSLSRVRIEGGWYCGKPLLQIFQGSWRTWALVQLASPLDTVSLAKVNASHFTEKEASDSNGVTWLCLSRVHQDARWRPWWV